MVGISSLFSILVSIDSPFDEFGMDDIRITSDSIQFKNDINLLTIEDNIFTKFSDLEKMEKNIKHI